MKGHESGRTMLIVILLFILLGILSLAYIFYHSSYPFPSRPDRGIRLQYRLPVPESTDPAGVVESSLVVDTVHVLRRRLEESGLREFDVLSTEPGEVSVLLPEMGDADLAYFRDLMESQGQLEWLTVAENETDADDPSVSLDVDEKRKALIQHLKGLEEGEEGGWNLDADLSSLNFSLTINGELARYRWIAWSKESIEKENDRRARENMSPIPVPSDETNTMEALGLGEAQPETIDRYFLLIKRFDNEKWQFSGQDLKAVSPSFDRNNNPAVEFEFKSARAHDFEKFTESHTQWKLSLVFDNKVGSDPVIQDALPGHGIISGPQPMGFTLTEQNRLLALLRSGSLPVKLEFISAEPFDVEKE